MPDPDDLLRALRAPSHPPRRPLARGATTSPSGGGPRRVRCWRPPGWCWRSPWQPEPSRARGAELHPATFDLRMVVERGGVAKRVATGTKLRLGERVMFRVSADRATSARLWVEEPTGTAVIVETDAGPVPQDVGDGRGLVGYRFESPGRHVFHLTSGAGGECADCPSVAVEVE